MHDQSVASSCAYRLQVSQCHSDSGARWPRSRMPRVAGNGRIVNLLSFAREGVMQNMRTSAFCAEGRRGENMLVCAGYTSSSSSTVALL